MLLRAFIIGVLVFSNTKANAVMRNLSFGNLTDNLLHIMELTN